MTTVLGIHVPRENRIVLASDRQGTFLDAHEKMPAQKIYVSKNKAYAFGVSGHIDQKSLGLMEKLANGQIDVNNLVAGKRFNELRDLNIDQMGDRDPELKKLTNMLLAIRKGDNKGLYSCLPMGAVDSMFTTFVGSGSKFVEEYFKAKRIVGFVEGRPSLIQETTTTVEAIELATNGILYATHRDLYSTGFDLVVISSSGIENHTMELSDKGFNRRLKGVQRKYSPKGNSKRK